jgi:hypothetical protein
MQKMKKIYLYFTILVFLTPLGLLVENSAFGEWKKDELKKIIGFIPIGIKKLGNLWNGIFPDYTFSGFENSPFNVFFYIFSAVVGSIITILITYFLTKFFFKRKKNA